MIGRPICIILSSEDKEHPNGHLERKIIRLLLLPNLKLKEEAVRGGSYFFKSSCGGEG